ncbi:hypothetical protein Gotri_025459 [Gossypium trilobum]|uniref:Putative plant transposon protein domain-containing protein n=1 Tax=Gossypium trilobum TaxID=34281 RepID=A0A7J9FNE9_9ROSI|nr:hypothetical protein [Gossypium trilobum]
MKINGEAKTFKCGYQLNEENGRKLGEHCKKLSISDIPKSREMHPFMDIERINRFRERNKRARAECHNGWGFDPSMILCKEILPLVRYHRWERFWTIPKDNSLFLIVQEFYASPRYHESRNIEGHIWDTILVRRKEVQNICRDIDMDNIINFVTEGRGEWKYRAGTNILVSFPQAIMFPEAKMWIQFVCTRIVPTLNVSNVNAFRAFLLYAIFHKKQVYVGKWIHQNMGRCISSQKDTLFQQYIELRAEQIKVWNKQQQEMITTPTLSKSLARAQLDVGGNSHPKKNNIRVPNYTPDMFGLTRMEQEEEEPESEAKGEKEEDDGDDEIDDVKDD